MLDQLPTLYEEAERERSRRIRSIWDARRLLHPQRGRLIRVVYDDGQHASVVRHGVYLDVLKAPHLGLALKLKGFLPFDEFEEARVAESPEDLRRITVLPLRLIRDLPAEFRFLQQPAESWAFPTPWVRCPRCGGEKNAGRFCSTCGTKLRKGVHLGEGFSSLQRVLSRRSESDSTDVMGHSCGALALRSWTRCIKCGRPLREVSHG